MGRKIYLPLILFTFLVAKASAQTGEIRGKITEKGGKEIPFASVAALVNGVQVQAAVADFEGNYSIKPLNPAKYDVKATSVGFQPVIKAGVIVTVDNISFVDIELGKGIEIKEVEVVDYVIPLIDPGSTDSKKTLTFDDIQALPTRDVNSAAVQAAGVYQGEEGGELNIRGSRSDGTSYYIDGIKVTGSPGISQRGTEQISVITGGIPAQYGDATGGIISVTTRGPSNEFGVEIEGVTSELLDDFGHNLANASVTGPIYRKRDEDGKKTGQSIAGFFFTGEYQYDKDPDPPAIPIYTVKEDLLQDVLKNPLTIAPSGQNLIHRSSYFTMDSMEQRDYRQNVDANTWRLNGKIDIRPANNFTLTLGGSFERTRKNEYSEIYRLMNYDNNTEEIATKWRAFAKITQRFTSESAEKASSAIKNAFYSIQVDYTQGETIDQSETHKKNLFNYGHVGKFTSYRVPFFSIADTIDGSPDTLVYVQDAVLDTLLDFEPGNLNPNTTNYTIQYYDVTSPFPTFGIRDNPSSVVAGGGLLNGDNRPQLDVYGLWATTGRVATQYQIAQTQQGRISASGSADIKNHNIIIGLEYEQRTERGFSIIPSALWSLMRQLSNQSLKLNGFDFNSADTSLGYNANGDPGYFVTYGQGNYIPLNNSEGQVTRGFYENVRDQFGIDYGDTIQTDSYDPDDYNIGLFTPDELLNNGNSLIAYYGYDYTGSKKTTGSWDLNDFYVDKDENNNFLRSIDAFRPVYMAGYISDRFSFNDIFFNIGVRVDRFDANQKVLKDPYSLYELHHAGDFEVKNLTDVPDNIGDDFAVYVNNSETPTEVVGYRNGSTWYDANGTVITDLDPLTQSGSIQPYLTNYEDYRQTRVNPNAFTDYEPQVTVMPRIAFSFPISDVAMFKANYDILTQRPQSSNLLRFDPTDYLRWSQKISGNYSNPNLKPQKTTSYEIRFEQRLSRSSAFGIAAFYKEIKDDIQFINVDFAFPIKYTTYGNIDFGTIKGLTFNYDLRRTSNIRLNLSYTLSFAEGTGSSATSNSGILAQAGQTNLREIKPFSYDQRHTLVTSFDFHYGKGAEYNGPVVGNSQILSDMGLNVTFHAGSGAPYTRQSNITPIADFTTTANSKSTISGSVNGSRYPWNFRIDAKLDKSFELFRGKDTEGNSRRPVNLIIYLQVLNVLNTLNINSVYAATGSASDDGYITSPGAQTAINSQPSPQAYRDLYYLKINNPNNYDLPRRIRFGMMVNF